MPAIDPRRRGQLPRMNDPVPFRSPDGKTPGWKVQVPGGRPLATPAVADGRVFLGGGFGSYDFYALDADTGRVVWQYQTNDDGPTAAVVADGYVAFNTESCELEVLTAAAGRPVWKKWLGDPLMSMPAIDSGRIYMAYPDSRGDHRHYLACFELATGRQVWKQPLSGEVITAPVVAERQVYAANLDGTLCCFAQEDGRPLWQEPRDATSSPVVWRQQCYFSQRRELPAGAVGRPAQQMEHLARKASRSGAETEAFLETATHADYLDYDKRSSGSVLHAATEREDQAVGFGAMKGDSKMEQARRHLGHGSVSALWSYQGSKPFLYRGRLFSALGDTLHCADPVTKEVFWKRRLRETEAPGEVLDSVLTPPATVNGKLILGSIEGHVYCLSAESGETLWDCGVGEPVIFQPAVARGRVYVPTRAGSLVCLETGDAGDDGWLMWGATPAHNGLPE
jgi:outer membrane protein assembly factor BamB